MVEDIIIGIVADIFRGGFHGWLQNKATFAPSCQG
jgi:hypothetical protein